MKLLSLLVVSSVIGCVLFAGCEKKVDLAAVYGTNIKKVHLGYRIFMASHNDVGPKDEASFKEYLKTDHNAVFRMKRVDVTPETVEEIFVSERDGQPFKIRYGLKGSQNHAVVFESVGIDGKRMIAFGKPIEVDEAEYERQWVSQAKPEKVYGIDDFQ